MRSVTGISNARVVPEANFEMFSWGFHHDRVGNRTDDCKIARERGRQREHLPHQRRIGEVGDPFSGHENEGDVGKNVSAGHRKPT